MADAAAATKPAHSRRIAILDEAVRMFGEFGYNGLTVHGLAERCRITGAGLLYYFKSKEDLLLAVLDEIEAREIASIAPMLEASEQPGGYRALAWDALRALVQHMMDRACSHPEVTRFVVSLQAEALEPSHVAYHWFRKREQLTLDLLSALLSPHVEDPASNSRHVLALMQGLEQQWLRQDMAFDIAAELDKVLDAVLGRGRL